MSEAAIETLFKKHDVLSDRMTQTEQNVAVLKYVQKSTNEKIEGISHQLSIFTGEVRSAQEKDSKKLDKIIEQYNQQKGATSAIVWVCATLIAVVAAGTGVIALLRG